MKIKIVTGTVMIYEKKMERNVQTDFKAFHFPGFEDAAYSKVKNNHAIE